MSFMPLTARIPLMAQRISFRVVGAQARETSRGRRAEPSGRSGARPRLIEERSNLVGHPWTVVEREVVSRAWVHVMPRREHARELHAAGRGNEGVAARGKN